MKNKNFIVIWIIITAGIYYFWSLRNVEKKAELTTSKVLEENIVSSETETSKVDEESPESESSEASEENPEAEVVEEARPEVPIDLKDDPLSVDLDTLPPWLKGRINNVLSQIEGMWDPNGTKVIEIGKRMDALEVALEEDNTQQVQKILAEMEVIISEK